MSTWTNKQLKLLRELYPTAPKAEIEQALPTHTWNSIVSMAADHKIRRRRPCRNWLAICQSHVMQTGIFKIERIA